MSRKKELQNKLEDFQKSLDDLYEKQYGSDYSHHSDYQKYSDIASSAQLILEHTMKNLIQKYNILNPDKNNPNTALAFNYYKDN